MTHQHAAFAILLIGGLVLIWKAVEFQSDVLSAVAGLWFLGGVYIIIQAYPPRRD